MGATLTFRLLGECRIERPDREPIGSLGRKSLALLCYLALQRGVPAERERLAALLWPDRFDTQARHSLRQCLHELRCQLGKALPLTADNGSLALNPEALEVDALKLRDLLGAGRNEAAMELYGGDLMNGLSVRADGFEQWLAAERQTLRSEVSAALLRLAHDTAAAGDPAAAAGRLTEIDPAHEAAHRLLIRLHHQAGRRTEALRQYEACVTALRRELDVEPSPETTRLYHRARSTPQSRTAEQPDRLPFATPSPPVDRPSVIVMPFVDRSGSGTDEHVVDAVTDEVIAALGRYRWLFVIGRNTSFAYEGQPTDPARAAIELGVRYVVSGSVRRHNGRVRVLAEVVEAPARRLLWSEQLERHLSDFYDMQEELARSIVGAIEPELMAAESRRAAAKPVLNLDAWERVVRARMLLHRSSREAVFEADSLAAEATAIDPESPHAFTILAWARFVRAYNHWDDDPQRLMQQSLEAAQRALQIDDKDAEARTFLARAHAFFGRGKLAVAQARQAVEINPSAAQAHVDLGVSLLCAGQGEEALASFSEARRLSPRDPRLAYWMCAEGYARFALGRFEEAIACDLQVVHTTTSHMPRLWSHVCLAASYGCSGRPDEARAAVNDLLWLSPGINVAAIAAVYRFPNAPQLLDALRRAGLPDSAGAPATAVVALPPRGARRRRRP